MDLKNVTESDHEIKLTKDGYKEKTIRIRTVKGFKLEALVFLGINSEVATPSSTPSPSSAISVTKILILDTPTGFLRVRDKPSLSGKEVAQVKPGDKLILLEEVGSWDRVRLSVGIEGYVSSSYVEKKNPQTPK